MHGRMYKSTPDVSPLDVNTINHTDIAKCSLKTKSSLVENHCLRLTSLTLTHLRLTFPVLHNKSSKQDMRVSKYLHVN